jgi:hypothetical protein
MSDSDEQHTDQKPSHKKEYVCRKGHVHKCKCGCNDKVKHTHKKHDHNKKKEQLEKKEDSRKEHTHRKHHRSSKEKHSSHKKEEHSSDSEEEYIKKEKKHSHKREEKHSSHKKDSSDSEESPKKEKHSSDSEESPKEEKHSSDSGESPKKEKHSSHKKEKHSSHKKEKHSSHKKEKHSSHKKEKHSSDSEDSSDSEESPKKHSPHKKESPKSPHEKKKSPSKQEPNSPKSPSNACPDAPKCKPHIRVGIAGSDSILLESDSKGVIPHTAKPNVTAPLSFSNLRLVYGYTLFPKATSKRSTVAIVDAYLYRTSDGNPTISTSMAPRDLTTFCSINNFKPPTLMAPIVLSGTVKPIAFGNAGPYFVEAASSTCGLDPSDNANSPGWPLEQALDFQAIYGMSNTAGAAASGPNIILVHANSDSFTDLNAAIAQAIAMGADVVSCSWGASEFSGETYYDSTFTNSAASKVAFCISTGDEGFASYPAMSPFVVGVGGTSLSLNGGTRVSEAAWGNQNASGNSGGGTSGDNSGPASSTLPVQEPTPSYQSALGYKGRTIPDLSFFASPNPGVQIVLGAYRAPHSTSSYSSLYYSVGGTSLSAPCIAALVANANQIRFNNAKAGLTSVQILTALYASYAKTTPTSYCQGLMYNVVQGSTYLYKQTITTSGGRTNSTWSYVLDNTCVPVASSHGFDKATGIGVPSSGLIAYLASL